MAADFYDQWEGDPSKAHLRCNQKNDSATGDERSTPYTGTVNDGTTAIECSVSFELRRIRIGEETLGEYLTIRFTKNLKEPGLPARRQSVLARPADRGPRFTSSGATRRRQVLT